MKLSKLIYETENEAETFSFIELNYLTSFCYVYK